MVHSTESKSYPPGIHVPSLTWFADDANQEIDWPTQEKHLEFLISSGLHGIVIAGTNGEAVSLSAKEKFELTSRTRKIATDLGRPDITVTLGCGGQTTKDVINETKLARDAGADFALVLIPSYFHFAMNEKAIVEFFQQLADASPIPIVLYNFPGVVAGLDINSEMLETLGAHPNIAGVKLTCGGIAKVARVRAVYAPEQFSALAGQSDWLLPALVVGGTGCITGLANLYPKCCIQIYDHFMEGKMEKARNAQLKLAQAEWGFGKGGINGTKWVVAQLRGYPTESSHCRRPFPQFTDNSKQEWITKTVSILQQDEMHLSS